MSWPAARRVACVAGHIAVPEPAVLPADNAKAQAMAAMQNGPSTEDAVCGEFPAEAQPIIAMMEAPAEDAVTKLAVEEAFAKHDLKVVWALEEKDWQSAVEATVLITVKKKVDRAVLDTLPQLKLVAVAFTGYDHVDLEACQERGVAVANVPGYSTNGVAELCFGLIFALLRHIPMAHQHIRAGKWAWPPGNELAGRRLGLIGTGQIGLRVAEIGKAFRVSSIIGYDTVKNPKFTEDMGGEYVSSLATVFLHADVVVVACALTPSTKGLVSEKMLKLLRPDSILINCSRGAIIDQASLTNMLGKGRFRAGLDVYEVEPLPEDHPLRSVPESNLVCTPHLAYKCHESLTRRLEVTLDNILAFLANSPQNIVSK